MCGVVGFVDPGGRTPDPETVLRAMREALVHRGPDDAGEVILPPLWAAHRRLSIVDLSEAGRQPFVAYGDDGSPEIVALANAEIYNHGALRDRIAAAWPGLAVPASDCAVLPWVWRLEREHLPDALRGMHAVAIWDARVPALLLARDPAGQKPMYFAELPGGGLAFASEPKALLRHPLVGRDLDPVGLRRYMAFDYTPGSGTVFRQIQKLAPGARLHWRDGRHRIDVPGDILPADPPLSDRHEAGAALWDALGDAVEARLMSDVPVGVFLSGGLDSTAVVAALAERMDPSAIRTFSVGFDDPAFDESAAARMVAEHFGTHHHALRLDAASVISAVPEILALGDEPFADPSIIPTYLLSRFARAEVTVALGGDGGDELLLGYPTFMAEGLAKRAALVPRAVRHGIVAPLARRLPPSTRYMGLDFKLNRFLSGLDLSPDRRHPVWIGGLPPAAHGEALAPGILEAASDDQVFAPFDRLARRYQDARPAAPDVERLAWAYARTYLADDVLMKVDRASMAHGLEVRSPFLDHEVRRVCARIPVPLKLAGSVGKKVLRDVLRSKVPAPILSRPKRGFALPVAAWLRGPLLGWMKDVLQSERVARGGLIDPGWTSRLIAEHESGRANHRKPLWSAISLELWRAGPFGPGDCGP